MSNLRNFILLSITPIFIYAGGLQLLEVASPGLGTANVGQTAISIDPSIAYYNPAGMTNLQKSELLVGAQLFGSNIKFKQADSSPVPGNNGGQIGRVKPGIGLYSVWNVSDRVKLGVSLNTPYGAGLDYDKKWTGRYLIEEVSLLTLDFNPSIGIKITDWISIGGGAVLEYGYLKQKVAISPTVFHEPANSEDGRLNISVDDTIWGYNLGVLFSIKKSRLGISYRSQLNHAFKGHAKVNPVHAKFNINTRVVFPQNVLASLYQPITNKINLLLDFGWQQWKKNDAIVITSDKEGPFSLIRDWKDVWHYGIGAQYSFTKKLLWQAGFAYDTSPTNKKKRTPDMPIDRQIRVGTGFIYDWRKDITFTSAFEYLNNADAKIDIRSLKGKYSDFSIYFINFTFSKKF